jgi:hypothetical protein
MQRLLRRNVDQLGSSLAQIWTLLKWMLAGTPDTLSRPPIAAFRVAPAVTLYFRNQTGRAGDLGGPSPERLFDLLL